MGQSKKGRNVLLSGKPRVTRFGNPEQKGRPFSFIRHGESNADTAPVANVIQNSQSTTQLNSNYRGLDWYIQSK